MANNAQMEKSPNLGISGSQLKGRGSGTENEETEHSRDNTDLTMIDASYAYLPTEILIKIFHYLNFHDIQAARLCCTHWFDISNYPEFASERLLKITDGVLNSKHPAAKVISASKIENLYLKDIRLGDVDELFKEIGPNLKTLTLESHLVIDHLPTFTLFTNLQSLKVCGFGDDITPECVECLPSGDLSRLKELELTMTAPYVSKYLLRCSLCSNFLEKLTLEVYDESEVEVLKILDKQAETLKILDLHFNRGRDPNADISQWKRIASKLSLTELSLREFFSPVFMVEMVKNQKSLRSLLLHGFSIVNDEHLTLIVQNLPQLERLFLFVCDEVTDIGVGQLAKLPKLFLLNLQCCQKITSDGIRSMIGQEARTRLQELRMSYLRNVDMDAVCYCAQNLQNLRVLDLSGCYTAVTDESVNEIFKYRRNLEALMLDDCKQLTDIGMLGLSSIRKLQKFECLSLLNCEQLSDKTLCGISAPHLKSLDIRGFLRMTSRGISILIRNCPAIEEISFTYSEEMNEELLDVLTKGLSRLRTLGIEDCSEVLKQGTSNWKPIHFEFANEEVILRRRT